MTLEAMQQQLLRTYARSTVEPHHEPGQIRDAGCLRQRPDTSETQHLGITNAEGSHR